MTLRSLLGVDVPVIQAPMAGSQGSALAAAVSNAGGLGSLPAARLTPDGLRSELARVREQTSGPVNVNFFCHAQPAVAAQRESMWRVVLEPYYREFGIDPNQVSPGAARVPFGPDFADVLAEDAPAVVSFHFGLPSPDLVARVKGWGSVVLASATTVEEARWLEERAVDAVVAQGSEAGGHRGMFLSTDLTTQVGTLALLPQVVKAVDVPVIAAGGIADHRGVAAALALGAAGVQAGTTFLLCPEATTSAVHRAALTTQAARHTALTNLFSGRPARGIVNRLIRELGPMRGEAPPYPLATPAVALLQAEAERRGSGDFSPLWAGQNTSGCLEVPAAELTHRLAAGF
ncbi:nitronate monooxygenase [Phytoactinopolyspora alkaliphila]|uniref:Probable nitronate monooxygenase n=1 Tax=Phytoactinopolyspora alkaliphila TaxID=1783498 RepID=A0A6N9YSP2_9ACTN|nr:nitronate monooxygenase [Phytoactinopolyspora alkaliphila]NED97957.1 nitronate monooxygenase [Phytoactinopolyspora alkaliphila]